MMTTTQCQLLTQTTNVPTEQLAVTLTVEDSNLILQTLAPATAGAFFLRDGRSSNLVLIPIPRDKVEKWVTRKGCGISS